MIEFERVSHAFGDRVVLKPLSIRLSEKRIGVIGANGSGKTTFARLLNGLIVPKEGSVHVDGLSTARDGKAVRQRVGFLFQDPDNQIVMPLVEEDIAFSLKPLRLSPPERERKIDEILNRYGLQHYRKHPSHGLSGGEKQLLALSSVLVRDPAYLVLDEPTTLLDLKNKKRVEEAIKELDATIICVSHDLDFIAGFDRVLVFEEGAIVFDGAAPAAVDYYVRSQT